MPPAGKPNATSKPKPKGAGKAPRLRQSLALDPNLLQSSGSDGEGDQISRKLVQPLRERTTTNSSSNAVNTTKASVNSTSSSRMAARLEQQLSPSRRSRRISSDGLRAEGDAHTNGDADAHTVASTAHNVMPTLKPRKKANKPDNASQSQRKAAQTINKQPTPPDSDVGETMDDDEPTIHVSAKKTRPLKKVKPALPLKKNPALPLLSTSDNSDDFAFTIEQPSQFSQTASQQGSHHASTSGTSGIQKPTKTQLKKNSRVQPTALEAEGALDISQAVRPYQPGKRMDTERSHNAADVGNPHDRKGKRKADHAVDSSQETGSQREGVSKKGRLAGLGHSTFEPGTPPSTIPVYTQETPAIQRNLAMRAGLPPGTPRTLTRRTSSDMRGRRGSSIGNGFEALPHPSLPTNTLYRHIKADDPPVIRFRTLVTWSSHRLKESLDQSKSTSDSVRRKASKALEGLIADLAEKRLDFSWNSSIADEEDGLSLGAMAKLPPNPVNEANSARLAACQAWTARLQAEDAARNSRINAYKSMTENITRLTSVIPPAPAIDADGTPGIVPDLLQPNWQLPVPRMQTMEDALAYGKRLLQPPSSNRDINDARNRRKSVAASSQPPVDDRPDQDPDVIDAHQELGTSLEHITYDAANIHQLAYRLDQFLKLSNTYLKNHLATSYMDLTHLSEPHTSSSSALLPSSTVPGSTAAKRSIDYRSLLRAISRADSASTQKLQPK